MKKGFVGIASSLLFLAITGIIHQNGFGQINSPATNSFLVAGSDQKISWDVSKDSTSIVLLQYSTDAGRTWNLIASSGIAAGSYDWIVPPTINSFQCKMRMVSYSSKGFKSIASTGNFSIARVFPTSTINEVFSHRVIAVTDTGKKHYNRMRFFK